MKGPQLNPSTSYGSFFKMLLGGVIIFSEDSRNNLRLQYYNVNYIESNYK